MSSGDILLSTANTEHKREMQSNTDWLAALDESASIVTPLYHVLVHGIRIEAVDMTNLETTIESLRAENISITSNARIVKIAWAKKQHAASQTDSSLVVSFNSPMAADEAVKRGLVYECIIHDCELWDNRCRRRQCFHCQRYGHLAPGCRNPTACAYCAGNHDIKVCDRKDDKTAAKCAACNETGHTAWDRSYPLGRKEDERVKDILSTRPILYQETDMQLANPITAIQPSPGTSHQKATEPAATSFSFSPTTTFRGRTVPPTRKVQENLDIAQATSGHDENCTQITTRKRKNMLTTSSLSTKRGRQAVLEPIDANTIVVDSTRSTQ